MGMLIKHGPNGNCPVQAEGTFDGAFFYFRARGENVKLLVGTSLSKCLDAEPYGRGQGQSMIGQMLGGSPRRRQCRSSLRRMESG